MPLVWPGCLSVKLMHELSIAQEIISIVKSSVQPEELSRVSRVEIKVGKMQNVLVESLVFCFAGIKELDNLNNAELVVKEITSAIRCKECSAETEIEGIRFACVACGSASTELIRGTELQVSFIDIDD